RRHTRSKRDWSSDVCSSDLEAERQAAADKAIADRFNAVSSDAKFVNDITQKGILDEFKAALLADENKGKGDKDIYEALTKDREEIGRASCRERRQIGGVAVG